ncbi:MAG: hypothetical protein Q9N68_05125 [Gammaproteobacteria bacterium]|nr:hypothetical protein [Gammaproteobacteria bacterium]
MMIHKWLFFTTLISSLNANAQNQMQLESGLTFSDNNLFNQQNNTPLALPDQPRLGLQIALAGHWQQFSNQGGLSASAYAYQDSALQQQNAQIQQLNLQAQKLLALSNNWLSRSQLTTRHYQNQQQPISSNLSFGLNHTFGYFANDNSGLDLTLGLQQRNYNHIPSGNYQGQQWESGAVYYFASPANHARWAAALTLQKFNASETFYNSVSQQFDLSYGQWQWQQLQGTLALQWQKNLYPNTARQLNETYTLLSVNSHYTLSNHWQLVSTLSSGQYQPNNDTPRSLLNAYLGLKIQL